MARVPVEYRMSSRDVYLKFCKQHPEIDISYKKWLEVIYTYNYGFRDYLIETGAKAKLPWGLGYFSISGKKTKKYKIHHGEQHINLAVDWKETRKLGKRVYHLNSHTDGKKFRWYWFKSESHIYQADMWIFKPSRLSSRGINQGILTNGAEHYKKWDRK